MGFAELVATFEALEGTSATLQKTDILSSTLAEAAEPTLPLIVHLVRGQVFPDWDRRELGVSSSLTVDAIDRATGVGSDRIETEWREAGDLGDAAAWALEHRAQRTLGARTLTVESVASEIRSLATFTGDGSQDRRVGTLAGLLADATPEEARYIVRIVLGTMRLGVGAGIVRDAIADAFLDSSENARTAVGRAVDVTTDFGLVAETARAAGIDGLQALDVELFRPVKPMLAGTADGLEGAVADLARADGSVLVEMKYDGIRAKIHRDGDDIELFSRRLEPITAQFPEVVSAAASHLAERPLIAEAEIVAVDPDGGDPVPFQELSRRVKRESGIEAIREAVPVRVFLFDLIYLDGESLLDVSLADRLVALDGVLERESDDFARAEAVHTDSIDRVRSFYERALAAGHEGIMIKNLAATYQPGSRVGYQRKVKPTMEPLDLVVTRAKWSEGRKSDYLGRPYLACRGEDGDLLEIGRMHTGFTDTQLETFTDLVEPLIRSVDGREAELEPSVVLEVEYEEIQRSPTYDSGFALRFPRLKRIRTDLDPSDADDIDRVRRLFEAQ